MMMMGKMIIMMIRRAMMISRTQCKGFSIFTPSHCWHWWVQIFCFQRHLKNYNDLDDEQKCKFSFMKQSHSPYLELDGHEYARGRLAWNNLWGRISSQNLFDIILHLGLMRTPVRTSSYNDIISGTPGCHINVALVTLQKDQCSCLMS